MLEKRLRANKKKRKELDRTRFDYKGEYKVNPVVETGALIAEYASKDDEISALWFKTISDRECAAIVEYIGDGKRISQNIRALSRNQPGVKLTLYSSRSKYGEAEKQNARLLYSA